MRLQVSVCVCVRELVHTVVAVMARVLPCAFARVCIPVGMCVYVCACRERGGEG